MGVLQSSNLDLAINAVNFLLELTEIDVDMQEDTLLTINRLTEELLSHRVLEILCGLLFKLDKTKEVEKEAVFKVLGIFENVFELQPLAVEVAGTRTNLVQWILGTIATSGREYNDNNLYASEILSIIVQQRSTLEKLAEVALVPKLTEHLKLLLHPHPFHADYKEMMLNLFNCLCSALITPQNQLVFAEQEGIDIMIKLLK